MLITICHILASELRQVITKSLYGLPSPTTSPSGHDAVAIANPQKSSAMSEHHSKTSPRRLDVSATFISTSLNQLANIAEFTTDIRFIEGKANVVADALSRITITSVFNNLPAIIAEIGSDIDFTSLAQAQANDPEITRLRRDSAHGLRLRDVRIVNDTLLCDTSTGVARPIVPAACRRRIFDAYHNLSHPSVRATRQLITKKFVWPAVTSDIAEWTRCCRDC